MPSIYSLQDCYCKLKEKLNSLVIPPDLTNQLSSLQAKVEGQQVPIYRMSEPTPGVNVRRWLAVPDALSHDNVDLIWTGPVDLTTGFPTHPNTPTADIVEADWNYTGPDDQMEAWAWIELDQPTFLRDNNGNTGERGEVWIAECCGQPKLLQQTIVNTPSADRILLDPVLIPAGLHLLYVRQSDASANQGFDLEQSIDGVAGWANFNGPTWSEKPEVECELHPVCDPVPEGWSLKYPESCNPVFGPAVIADTHDEVLPSSIIPIADNEVDTAIRTGQIGTSLDYARADHNHPIRVQANPGDPIPTFTTSAGSSVTQTLILRRVPEEEAYSYKFRIRWAVNAGTGWNFIFVPPIGGFHRPILTGIGTYRQTSNTPQDDDGVQGASPRGPYMGKEAHEWTNTGRVYLGHFRRENNYVMFVEFWARYVRL